MLNFAYPSVVFLAISSIDITSAFIIDYVIVYGGLTIAIYWLGFIVSLRLLRRQVNQSALNGLGLIFCNTAFMGYPRVSASNWPRTSSYLLEYELVIREFYLASCQLFCCVN